MKQWIVLKPTGPMNLANGAGLKIRQGQVVTHPGYLIPEDTFDIFNDKDKALAQAAKNAEMKEVMITEGITNMKTLAKAMQQKAKSPTAAEREDVRKNAKVMDEDGNLTGNAAEEIASLKAENEKLREEANKANPDTPNPNAYLDQNTRTVVKRVKTAAKTGKLTKVDVQSLVTAESEGQKRKGVLDKLKNMIKNDAIFGKLFKK